MNTSEPTPQRSSIPIWVGIAAAALACLCITGAVGALGIVVYLTLPASEDRTAERDRRDEDEDDEEETEEPTVEVVEATEEIAMPTLAPTATVPPLPTALATEAVTEAASLDAECIIPVERDAYIVFSGWGDGTEQQLYESVARFMELCPGVVVDYQPIPYDYWATMQTSMAAGTAPDVFYADDQLMAAFAPSGQLLPLDDVMAEAGVSRNDFLTPLMAMFVYDGQTYALPKDWVTLGLVYLPEAFEQAGISEPSPDWTWDDLRAAAEVISQDTDYDGFCMPPEWSRFAPFAFGSGGAFTSDDFRHAAVDTPQMREAVQFVADMRDSGALVTPEDIGGGWCGDMFGQELPAMTYEGGWMVDYMESAYPDVEWRAAPLPAGPEGAANVIFTTGIGVNASTRYPRAAAAFALYLTGQENTRELSTARYPYSPYPDYLDLVTESNNQVIAQAGAYPLTRVAWWGPHTGDVNQAVSDALERVFLGEQTVQQALAQAQDEIQALLDE